MRRFYFRVDGGQIYSIATGHITRCLKLADYIANKEKAEINFIMKNYKEGIGLVRRKYKVIPLGINIKLSDEISWIKKIITKDPYFICDIRNINKEYINKIKRSCKKFVLFDDLGIKDLTPDILINPTPFCYRGYKKNDCKDTRLLLGEDFFFISQFLTRKANKRNFGRNKLNIMASFGGADPCNITEFFLQNIVPALREHRLSVVLGPAYKKRAEVQERYKGISNIKFYANLTSLDNIFVRNEIAFVTGGDTSIESCSNGLATFIISSIHYEKEIAKSLHKKRMVYFIGDIERINKGSFFNDAYLAVLQDKHLLKGLSENGMRLVDGRGLERIYNALLN